MASSSNSGNYENYDSLGELRRDSVVSAAVSETSATQSEADMYRYQRPQRTVSDTTIKRPMRLSNAHKRRVSVASVYTTNSFTVKPGQLIDASSPNAYDVSEDYGFPTDVNPNEYDISFTTPSDNTCSCCNIPHPNHAHDDEYPEKCWEHQICLPRGGWKKHLERYEHIRCPLSGCVRSSNDFASQEKFIKHWVKRHEEKCWYWGKKKNVFGSEKAVWLRWDGTGS
jgi:hypothetical protein